MVFTKVRLMHSSSSVNACFSNAGSPVHLMSFPVILVGLLVLVVVTPLQAQPLIPSGNSHNFDYKRYCSSSLVEILRLICGERYSRQQYDLNAPSNSDKYNSNSLKRSATNNDNGIYLRSYDSHKMNECCLRPCGYSELKTYCTLTE
ncbi:insulin-like peptide 6 isoform 1-T1 [Cochliomyia hominivorax]